MAVIKITFDGSSVSAKQDADLNYFLCGKISAGILDGMADNLTYSLANNYITFNSGYIQIYGRRIFIESGTRIYISPDSVAYGYVIIDVNLTTNNVVLSKVESSVNYPTLIQEDLQRTGTRYQFPIAKYSKTATAIILQDFDRTIIPTALSEAASGYNNAITYFNRNVDVALFSYPTSKLGTVYRYDFNDINLSSAVIYLEMTGTVLTIPGRFITGHSTFSLSYRVLGTDYALIGEYVGGGIVNLDTGSSDITIKKLYVYKFRG